MRYDELYERLVNRALRQTEIDLDAFFEDAIAQGMSADAVEERLRLDLETGGPIFGKFLNNVFGASEVVTTEAHRQAQYVFERADELRKLRQFRDVDIDTLLDDPESLENAEFAAGQVSRSMWVAELINTCYICLPLHGVILPDEEWRERGLVPGAVHSQRGWNSPCHCQLVLQAHAGEAQDELLAPLTRNTLESKQGLKGNRRTARALASKDIDRALRARDKALADPRGKRTREMALRDRRTLRLLGQSEATDE